MFFGVNNKRWVDVLSGSLVLVLMSGPAWAARSTIGVEGRSLSKGKTEAIDADGGVKVVKTVAGCPADGVLLTDDIITELSMINSIEIMSRNTTFDYKDNPIDVKEAAEKYKLDYVITGSIRSAGNRVRVSAELRDPISGNSIWSARYDKTMDDVFEIQDEIVSKMANTVLSEIEVTSLQRAKRKPTDKMTSYEYLLQGKFHKRKLTKEDANIAVDMFTNAIESDPSNGRAYAERCCTWADGLGQSWFDESDDDLHNKIRVTLEDAYELTGHDWDCPVAVQHLPVP